MKRMVKGLLSARAFFLILVFIMTGFTVLTIREIREKPETSSITEYTQAPLNYVQKTLKEDPTMFFACILAIGIAVIITTLTPPSLA